MHLTAIGAQAAMLGNREKQILADSLITGVKNIATYTSGVCYDTVAYIRYLLNANITPNELTSIDGQAWRQKFNFTSGEKWNGFKPLPPGTAIGFYRLVDNTVFHAAIAEGGSSVRATNGGMLGAGWQSVNLRNILGAPDKDFSFLYDRTKIFVYLSKL